MNRPGVLITGCDTGLGREFAIQYARAGFEVHAAAAVAASGRQLVVNHELRVSRQWSTR